MTKKLVIINRESQSQKEVVDSKWYPGKYLCEGIDCISDIKHAWGMRVGGIRTKKNKFRKTNKRRKTNRRMKTRIKRKTQ
jgi:hypothetical protein